MKAHLLNTAVLCSSLAATLIAPMPALAEPHPWHGPHGQLLDDRYHHGYYYPRVGAVFSELPGGYRTYWFHGANWYLAGGVWYQPGPGGFVVARPPAGLVVTTLPPIVTTVWISGSPYYYADDVYYRWDASANGYEVVSPPAGADQPEAAPTPAPDDLMIYPRNGQSSTQQSADRYECHTWASSQTGFDPTRPSTSIKPSGNADQYRRAMSACLEARGYSVK